jgi:hypothetical protein
MAGGIKASGGGGRRTVLARNGSLMETCMLASTKMVYTMDKVNSTIQTEESTKVLS